MTSKADDPLPHITVCVCTFRRAEFLQRLLLKLESQWTANEFTFDVVVCDNDAQRSGEATLDAFAARTKLRTTYVCEPRQNIALARNCALSRAVGEYIAFIDDDEFPADDWLRQLLHTCRSLDVAGVLGPVRPHFEKPPPNWILQGRFCERPEHPTGTRMEWHACRTGNLLFRRKILATADPPFLPAFGTGGEDKDFFMRMEHAGYTFVWCNEAVVYETVPPNRWTREYMLKRALLRGKNILKHPEGRYRAIATSLLGVPLYTFILPLALFSGQHVFMKFCIKWCDHAGRLLAVLGLNRVNERIM